MSSWKSATPDPASPPPSSSTSSNPSLRPNRSEKAPAWAYRSVHGIVTGHGGAIAHESEPGRGAAFHVFLPRLVGAVVPEAETTPAPAGGTEHILFLDDEESIVRLCVRVLEKSGYRVTGHTNVTEALEEAVANPGQFKLILCDVTMPVMTGIEFAQRLQQAGVNIPLVLMTGYNDLITPEECEQLGVRDLLTKPFAPADLARVARKTLDADR